MPAIFIFSFGALELSVSDGAGVGAGAGAGAGAGVSVSANWLIRFVTNEGFSTLSKRESSKQTVDFLFLANRCGTGILFILVIPICLFHNYYHCSWYHVSYVVWFTPSIPNWWQHWHPRELSAWKILPF